jgi:pantothenate kinase type III
MQAAGKLKNMILTFDIGNTTIVMGGYEGDNIAFRARLSTNIDRTDDEYAVL